MKSEREIGRKRAVTSLFWRIKFNMRFGPFGSNRRARGQGKTIMSPLTIYLARLAGLYCLFIALAMAANRRNSLAAIDGFLRSPALMLLAATIALAVGL